MQIINPKVRFYHKIGCNKKRTIYFQCAFVVEILYIIFFKTFCQIFHDTQFLCVDPVACQNIIIIHYSTHNMTNISGESITKNLYLRKEWESNCTKFVCKMLRIQTMLMNVESPQEIDHKSILYECVSI